jgi:hypothetical protein
LMSTRSEAEMERLSATFWNWTRYLTKNNKIAFLAIYSWFLQKKSLSRKTIWGKEKRKSQLSTNMLFFVW